MTGPTAEPLRLPSAVPDRAGLLERLVGVIRSEFRADELVFDATDSIFGGAACLVTDCARTARSRGLSQGHHLRWKAEGSPDVTVFAASTDPRWRRQQPNARCLVDGCGYGVAADRMCQLHVQRWRRAGRPDLHAWMTDPPAAERPRHGAVCAVPHCMLWPQAACPFCHTHLATWRQLGWDIPVARAINCANSDHPACRRRPPLRAPESPTRFGHRCRRTPPSPAGRHPAMRPDRE